MSDAITVFKGFQQALLCVTCNAKFGLVQLIEKKSTTSQKLLIKISPCNRIRVGFVVIIGENYLLYYTVYQY